mgnify:CR=1 FL=1
MHLNNQSISLARLLRMILNIVIKERLMLTKVLTDAVKIGLFLTSVGSTFTISELFSSTLP